MQQIVVITLCVWLGLLLIADGRPPATSTVSMATTTQCNGIESLNLVWQVPFKMENFVAGFRYRLQEIKKLPESVFFKNRPFNIAGGSASIDADYFLDPNVLSLTGNWVSNKIGLSLTALGNTKDKITGLAISKRVMLGGNDGVVNADYNVKTKNLISSGSVTVEKTTVTGTYLASNQELVVAVSHDMDEDNTISPVFFSSSGKMQYNWSRKFVGGALDTSFVPGENVRLSWTDRSQYGNWHTTADVPISTGVDIGKTKVSIKREWKY